MIENEEATPGETAEGNSGNQKKVTLSDSLLTIISISEASHSFSDWIQNFFVQQPEVFTRVLNATTILPPLSKICQKFSLSMSQNYYQNFFTV